MLRGGGGRATRTASFWKVLASSAMPRGTVAENSSAPFRRGRAEDEFEILAKTEVQHLVGLVQHHGAQRSKVQCAPW
jgi:hypothetical protein